MGERMFSAIGAVGLIGVEAIATYMHTRKPEDDNLPSQYADFIRAIMPPERGPFRRALDAAGELAIGSGLLVLTALEEKFGRIGKE